MKSNTRYRTITTTRDGLQTFGRYRTTLDLATREQTKILKVDPSLIVEIEVIENFKRK